MPRLILLGGIITMLLLSACKADPPADVDGTASTATATAPESTTTSEAPPTATPEPTATPGPKVIEIVGDEAFKAWTQRALELIETNAPDAYEEVLASIDIIEAVTAGSGMYVAEKRYAAGEQTAYAPGYDEEEQLVWYAGTIVHDAHHSAMFMRGDSPTGKDAEVKCLTVQKAALELLTYDPFFANYVQGLIDGADDPSNQYWNQPNRHW